GSTTDTYVYQAFGSIQASTGASVNPYRYVGQLGYSYDSDTSFSYLRSRYVSTAVGRFLSPDPLRFFLDLAGPYTYVGNSPIIHSDPSGLMWPPVIIYMRCATLLRRYEAEESIPTGNITEAQKTECECRYNKLITPTYYDTVDATYLCRS